VKTVDEWQALLRTRLRVAPGAQEEPASTVSRVALAAIQTAEAPPMSGATARDRGVFAGSVGGLGAGEVALLVLAPHAGELDG